MSTTTIQIRRKGVITLPVDVRREYSLNEGDVLTLVDLGDGSLLLTPGISQVVRSGDRVARVMEKGGVTVEDLLEVVDEEREAYYKEHYEQ